MLRLQTVSRVYFVVIISFALHIFCVSVSQADSCYRGTPGVRLFEDECTRLNERGGQTEYHLDLLRTDAHLKHYRIQCFANYPERSLLISSFCEEQKTVVDVRLNNIPVEKPSLSCGSVVSVESRTIGEIIPLIGSPYKLVYSSDRVGGRASAFQLKIPVIGSSVPSGMVDATVTVTIAGRTFTQTYSTANSSYDFAWDGKDVSNNQVNFATATVKVAHNYPSYIGDSPTTFQVPLGIPNHSVGLGGWGIDRVHFYESSYGRLYLGSGSTRSTIATSLTPAGYRGASEDGFEAYIFDASGYHVQTVNGLSGVATLTITYDNSHRITSLVDAYGNSTSVQRTSAGEATSILGPYGQTTNLTFNGNGNLVSVVGPNSVSYAMTYLGQGDLLQTLTKPSGEVNTIAYESSTKNLLSDSSSAGNSLTYSETFQTSGNQERHNVFEVSAVGRQKSTSTINRLTSFETIRTTPDMRSVTFITTPVQIANNGAEQE